MGLHAFSATAALSVFLYLGELHSLLRVLCLRIGSRFPLCHQEILPRGQRWVPRLNTRCWAISAPPTPDWPCCRRASLVRLSGSRLRSLLDLPTSLMRF